jgi:DNA invertase Pin-like site-specific DNA recombinase
MRTYIVYAQVSTHDQRFCLQIDALHTVGCAKVFVEQASSVQRDVPQQQAALDCGRPSETLVVWNLNHLARQLWVAPSMLYRHLPGVQSALREGWA